MTILKFMFQWLGTSMPMPNPRASPLLLKHIWQKSYNAAVTKPRELNSYYQMGSDEVYGETTFEVVEKMLEKFRLGPEDIFLDLGSGM